jgi:hypothetical protein
MRDIFASLDSLAGSLEEKGLKSAAAHLDQVANTLDMAKESSVSDLARARLFKSCGLALFVDMDGVLTDFERQYQEFGGSKITDGSKIDWELTKNTEYWADMPWKKDGKSLWKALAPFDPIILTSPTDDDYSKAGKREWVRRELGDTTRVIMDSQKWKYATPVTILIDDMKKNTSPWEVADGIAILHKKSGSTLKEFRKIVDEKCKELAG